MVRAVVVVVASLLAGCSIGDPPLPSGPSDGSVAGDARADAAALQWVDAAPGTGNNLPCKNLVNPAPTLGRHNPGKSCFQSCHDHGFTLAGTLYTNATGNTGFAGATMSFVDGANKQFEIVVNSNGNFYTSQAITFPVLIIASSCPSAVKMQGSSPNGACNTCHVGATSDQMHLP